MSNPLFRTVTLTPDAYLEVQGWAPSRRIALEKTLRERCLLFDPDGKAPPKYKRLMIPSLIKDETTSQLELDNWEQELIGDSVFGSTVELQGPGVLKTLRPVLQSCSHLLIVDPYLLSWRRDNFHPSALKKLLDNIRPNVNVQSVSCLGFKNDRDDRDRHHRRLGEICNWLSTTTFEYSRLKMYLYAVNRERDERYDIHDRFLCFQQSTVSKELAMALTIGYGASSLLTEKRHQVCLARISSRHFFDVWDNATKQADWQIVVSEDSHCEVGNHFQRLGDLSRKTTSGHQLDVFEYQPPND